MTAKVLPHALAALLTVSAGCSQPPGPNAEPIRPSPPAPLSGPMKPAGLIAPEATASVPPSAAGRFLAFTACRAGPPDQVGSLFLWDEDRQDVLVLTGAMAGLNPSGKRVGGVTTCDALEGLNPWYFGQSKVLFSFGTAVFVYDMKTEERITGVSDGQAPALGGPRATITADGKTIAYVDARGLVVIKPVDPKIVTKTRELSKLAAEAKSLDPRAGGGVILDAAISGDGRWLVVNIDGILFLYDVATPHLFQILPLSGSALSGRDDRIGHVGVSYDGRFIAVTVGDRDRRHDRDARLLVLDRATGAIDTVPFAHLGTSVNGDPVNAPVILNPRFCSDSRSLFFETALGTEFRVWKYDLRHETLRGLVTVNSVLGDRNSDVLLSRRALDP